MATPARKHLVQQAKSLGLRVLKSHTDEQIALAISEAVDKPGLPSFGTLSEKQIKKADAIRLSLNVINRLDDCFGFSFDSASEACRERCPENAKCALSLIKNEDKLIEDEKARALVAEAWKASGINEPFVPKPMLQYTPTDTTALKAKMKIKWLAEPKAAKKVARKARLDPELAMTLAELADDLKTYEDFVNATVAYNEAVGRSAPFYADLYFKNLATAGLVKLS